MIYTRKPIQFNPRFEVVSCFVNNKGHILLLHRQDHKPEGDTWGVPAGKMDDKEKRLETMTRELQEETGLKYPESRFSYFGKVYVRYPTYDFIYHIFDLQLPRRRKIILNPDEHKDYLWTSPRKALTMPLIPDLDECIRLFYKV
jgi:8-oxo-dGTP pyrophosphatase MutT (NUDIX family)